jgi:hypothetical protein
MTLEWLVGRMHVGTPDAEVREYVARRLRVDVEARERAKILRRAVTIHRRNRRLYMDVMSGRIGG